MVGVHIPRECVLRTSVGGKLLAKRVELGVRRSVAAANQRRNITIYRGSLLLAAAVVVGFGLVSGDMTEGSYDPIWMRALLAAGLLILGLVSRVNSWVQRHLDLLMVVAGLLMTAHGLFVLTMAIDPAYYAFYVLVTSVGFGASLRERAYLLPYAAAATWFTTAVVVVNDIAPPVGSMLVASQIALSMVSAWSALSEVQQVQTLSARDNLLTAVFHGGTDGLLVLDRYGDVILECNDRILTMFGARDEADVLGPIFSLGLLDADARWLARVRWEAQQGEVVEREVEAERRDGTRFWVSLVIQELEVSGRFVMLARLTDVTATRQMYEDLREAKEAAEAATAAKSSFLANMSHEIRTPMNGVLGLTDLLATTPLSDSQSEYVHAIRTSGESLLQIINEILDISKVEAGRVVLDPQPVNVASLATDLMKLFPEESVGEHVAVMLDLASDLPATVLADGNRLRQILINLMGNAIKFTSEGEVRLSIRGVPQASNADTCALQFEIADTGIGIEAEAIQTLFDAFTQADPTITRRYGGSGLGLAISHRLVELMGGKLVVRSTVGVGSTFLFTLHVPVVSLEEVAPTLPEHDMTTSERSMLSVLVVEDNMVNRLVARRMLDVLGYGCDVAENGLAALDALQDKDYDVVLMDLELPDVNGCEVTTRLRALDVEQPWVIALTASVLSEDKAACEAAGMDDFLAKPVSLPVLREVMLRANRRGDGVDA